MNTINNNKSSNKTSAIQDFQNLKIEKNKMNELKGGSVITEEIINV